MASDISSTCTFGDAVPSLARKMIIVKTVATADDTDTVVMTLADYGITRFLGCITFIHTTDLSVVTLETTDATTTAVASGDLTLTLAGTTDDKRRVIVVFGE